MFKEIIKIIKLMWVAVEQGEGKINFLAGVNKWGMYAVHTPEFTVYAPSSSIAALHLRTTYRY